MDSMGVRGMPSRCASNGPYDCTACMASAVTVLPPVEAAVAGGAAAGGAAGGAVPTPPPAMPVMGNAPAPDMPPDDGPPNAPARAGAGCGIPEVVSDMAPYAVGGGAVYDAGGLALEAAPGLYMPPPAAGGIASEAPPYGPAPNAVGAPPPYAEAGGATDAGAGADATVCPYAAGRSGAPLGGMPLAAPGYAPAATPPVVYACGAA
ncbi:hypothetical protein EON68_01975 [archaeon]|nr:MAG: hypothetical protein EON68_01975 [archaeon]